MITVKIKNINDKTKIPIRKTERSAGYDVVAVEDPKIVGESITKEGEFYPLWKRIDYIEYKTKLYLSPQDSKLFSHHNIEYYHIDGRSRSSIRKYNLILANSVATLDNDYRGEIIFCFKYIWQPEDYVFDTEFIKVSEDKNLMTGTYEFNGKLLGKVNREKIYKKGDAIAQLIAEKTNPMNFILVNELDETIRGSGAFGHTDNLPNSIVNKNSISNDNDNKSIVEVYNEAGGVPSKKRYIDEIKEREEL